MDVFITSGAGQPSNLERAWLGSEQSNDAQDCFRAQIAYLRRLGKRDAASGSEASDSCLGTAATAAVCWEEQERRGRSM